MDSPFLDTLTKPTPNSIESTVYRKPTQTDRYLDYNSNHPISAKVWQLFYGTCPRYSGDDSSHLTGPS